jgi:hypothetical protein
MRTNLHSNESSHRRVRIACLVGNVPHGCESSDDDRFSSAVIRTDRPHHSHPRGTPMPTTRRSRSSQNPASTTAAAIFNWMAPTRLARRNWRSKMCQVGAMTCGAFSSPRPAASEPPSAHRSSFSRPESNDPPRRSLRARRTKAQWGTHIGKPAAAPSWRCAVAIQLASSTANSIAPTAGAPR